MILLSYQNNLAMSGPVAPSRFVPILKNGAHAAKIEAVSMIVACWRKPD
jgi:hypothetical protein